MGYPGVPHRVTWVATPPSGWWSPPGQSARPPAQVPYYGPPAYPGVPRWGFPQLAWREPTSVPGTPARPPQSVRRVVKHARVAVSLLWAVAIAAFLAAGGEIWRYVLLVLGRSESLPDDVVAASDALVNTSALLAAAAGVIALILVLRWLLGIRQVAATMAGHRSARPDWQVLVGVLVPGLNLFVTGSVLAELEHTALSDPGARPRPSRLVLAWWAVWVVSEVLAVTTALLNLRPSVQARADSVLWYAATDLVAVAVAVLTLLVIGALTGLVAPTTVRGPNRMRVVRVEGAPMPPRVARP
ncbi:MAG TPA: DUF4328 domain-containing protein, partial [Pseudonocardiaceae bacterium]|nr:DUF4328 domain-containing protein [Pseudonocardiaceae bacterium]